MICDEEKRECDVYIYLHSIDKLRYSPELELVFCCTSRFEVPVVARAV